MKLAKRYVREFAADKKKYLQRVIDEYTEKGMESTVNAAKIMITEIDNIVNQCDYGYMSSFEAVKKICDA